MVITSGLSRASVLLNPTEVVSGWIVDEIFAIIRYIIYIIAYIKIHLFSYGFQVRFF